LLQSPGVAALEKGIGALPEVDVFFSHSIGEPVVLVQADPRREGKIRAHPNEHAPPTRIVEVDTVLIHPALCELEMPPVLLLVPVGNQDSRRLPGFQDQHNLIGLGSLKVWVQELIPAAFRSLQDRHAPLVRTNGYPISELICDVSQEAACHALPLPIRIEESDHPLRLLKGLNQTVQ
jgi:hypothetical protein